MPGHISDEIIDLCERGWAISLEEYAELRMNTYEREYILPYLSVEALTSLTENNLKNCQKHSKAVYDGILQEVIVPELLRRLNG